MYIINILSPTRVSWYWTGSFIFNLRLKSIISKYLLNICRTGINLDQLDKLSVIHVAGTKGKGSTCAFCESILRQYGYKTGFYSSPHLISIRERIQIAGIPLSKEMFAEYTFKIYNQLMSQRVNMYIQMHTQVSFTC